MLAIIALMITFLVGFLLRLRGTNEFTAWVTACFVTPLFILFAEYVLPSITGSKSALQISLVLGSSYGVIIGCLGVVAATIYLKRKKSGE